jgi:hypothetical protein
VSVTTLQLSSLLEYLLAVAGGKNGDDGEHLADRGSGTSFFPFVHDASTTTGQDGPEPDPATARGEPEIDRSYCTY